jgi:hypothetical protein
MTFDNQIIVLAELICMHRPPDFSGRHLTEDIQKNLESKCNVPQDGSRNTREDLLEADFSHR